MQFTSMIAELDSAAANFLAAYWERKGGARHMPARTEIDPTELKPILRVVLSQVEPQPFRFCYRLVGTRAVANGRFDCNGHCLDRMKFPIEDLDLNLLARDSLPPSGAKTED